jgi:hypothetical protein
VPDLSCTEREHGGTQAVSRRTGSPREARSEGPNVLLPSIPRALPGQRVVPERSPLVVGHWWAIEGHWVLGRLIPSTEFDRIPRAGPIISDNGGALMPEGQDPLATLLAATLSHLMLDVAKELFPHRSYFDLTSVEKQTVADHVRNLLSESQATFAVPGLLHPQREIAFPPQREEEYL